MRIFAVSKILNFLEMKKRIEEAGPALFPGLLSCAGHVLADTHHRRRFFRKKLFEKSEARFIGDASPLFPSSSAAAQS